LSFAARLHLFRRERDLTREQAKAAIGLSIEQGFSYWLAWGTILQGWALTEQGQGEEGIIQMRQGLAAYLALGAELVRPHFLALLAEAYGKVGQIDEGLTVLAEALALVNRTGERSSEAELYRLKGELTLQKGTRDLGLGTGPASSQAPSLKPLVPSEVTREAEEYFLKAIEIAQQQQAKSLELRATMSLVRLRQQQALQQGAGSPEQESRTTHHVSRMRLAEAHKLLSDVYNWFTEGFDTKDLQEAKALIEELSHGGIEAGI
jgi:predicted ATPase